MGRNQKIGSFGNPLTFQYGGWEQKTKVKTNKVQPLIPWLEVFYRYTPSGIFHLSFFSPLLTSEFLTFPPCSVAIFLLVI